MAWGLSFSMTCGILLPQLGTEPLSPALQGRFLASRPPVRSQDSNLHYIISKPMLQFGFPGSSAAKESYCNARDSSSISESGRSPGEGIGYPLHYSGLENSVDCIIHPVPKTQTWLSNFHLQLLLGLWEWWETHYVMSKPTPSLDKFNCHLKNS